MDNNNCKTITFPMMFTHTYEDGKKMVERWIAINGDIRQGLGNISYSPYSKKWLVWFNMRHESKLVNNLAEAREYILTIIK